MKETILDLQARSMRYNLVFSGITENPQENPEKTLTGFIQKHLKLPPEKVKGITFHHIHRIGNIKTDSTKPRPIVVKFENLKDKEFIKSLGKELKGTRFGLNDQFPKEIQDRQKLFYPIWKRLIQEGKRAVISVDKLYVDGKLYRDRNVTTWLNNDHLR